MEERILKAIESLRSDMDKRFDAVDKRFNALEAQVKENTQILKALEHAAQVNKAEHDCMMNDIAHIKGDVAALRKDLNKVEMVTASNWSDILNLKALNK